MKWKLLFIMFVALLLVAMVPDAVPAFLNHSLWTKASVNNQWAEYTLNIQWPGWWPH